MPKEKKYHKRKISANRQILADYNAVASSMPMVYGLIEVDVTDSLAKIEEIKEKQNYKVSMTAFTAKCLGITCQVNRPLNTFRKGRKLIVFDDVDVSVIIEIVTETGKKVPYNYVIRNADKKSVRTITEEIRSYQDKKIKERDQLARGQTTYTSLYTLIPKFIRRWVIRKIISNPYRLKKLAGTVGLTSMGMFIKGQGGWLIPFRDKTLNVSTGGIKNHLVLRDGKIEERQLLCTAFMVNHDIIDGAPGARFISHVSELLGQTTYLDDLDKI